MAGESEFAALLALPQEIARAVTESIKGSVPVAQMPTPGMPSGRPTGITELPREIARSLKDILGGAISGTEKGHGVGGFAGDFALGMSGQTMTRMNGILEPIAGTVKDFIGAIKSAFGPFEQLTDVASHFVEAFDPNLVRLLGQNFRDLNAIVGIALRPIVDTARDVVRYLSGTLLPIMRELEPIVAEISSVVKDVLMSTIDDLGNFLHDMMPVFRAIKDILIGVIHILKDVFSGLHVLVAAVIEVAAELLGLSGAGGAGGGVKQFMADLRTSIQDVIKNLLLFSARLLAMVGMTKGIDAMIKALSPHAAAKQTPEGMAAIQNVMFKSNAELGHSIQALMFAASRAPAGRTPQEQANEFLKDIKGELTNIKNNVAVDKDAVERMITKAVTDFFNDVKGEIYSHLPDKPQILKNAEGFARGAGQRVNAAGNFVGGFVQGFKNTVMP